MSYLDPAHSNEHTHPHEPGRERGKLGAIPHPHNAKDFSFENYAASTLRVAPIGYQHDRFTTDYDGMLGNDRVGDCVFAGGAHETILFTHSGGSSVRFGEVGVLSDYSAVTGYNPADPSTDQGADPVAAAAYRRNVGLIDETGARHKIGAYALLRPGDWHQMLQGLYFGEAISFCFDVPESAMEQFDAGARWSYVRDQNIIGGHYVCTAARPAVSVAEAITWGRRQQFTRSFFEHYNSLGIVYVSLEMLRSGKSPEGFDLTSLEADLAAL